MAELGIALAACLGTLLAGLWWGDRRGARRAWGEAQAALAASEDERGQLAEEVARLEELIAQAGRDSARRIERIQRVRALTLNDDGEALPFDTVLTAGRVLAALDRTPAKEVGGP